MVLPIILMSFLISPRKNEAYSIDRLRVAYADLLEHIDVASKDLGRRGIDDEDADFHKKSKRFSFRRQLIPRIRRNSTSNTSNDTESTHTDEESRDAPNNILSPSRESLDLAAAFRMMAATRSPDKEGDNFGAAATRDDGSVAAMATAKALEARVVELIELIGTIVINGDQPPQRPTMLLHGIASPRAVKKPNGQEQSYNHHYAVRSDPVFEYFCEKSVLSLLVDIAKESRTQGRSSESSFHGVVWSPLVKEQVFRTVSFLISDVRNHSILYYLLSQNHINELIQCMVPLKQWTDPALSKMMPAYVDLLKTLTLQLAEDPHLFSFLTVEEKPTDNNDDTKATIRFPLFSAALESAISAFAQSDSVIYGTCLVVIINIMQISYSPIQSWIINAGREQRRLAEHLCQRILDRYYRISKLTTGPVVDEVRSNAIAGQFMGLADQMGMIHEVFWSGVRGLDVRLCEALLQRVVTVLLRNMLPPKQRNFLPVGVVDADIVPETEAIAQVSTMFLAYLFSKLAYLPFQRMLAVALLHPKSTKLLLSAKGAKQPDSNDNYVFMPALSDIVTGQASEDDTIPNHFLEEIMKGLRGEYGSWRVVSSAYLMQCVFSSEAMERDTLTPLNIVPKYTTDVDPEPSALEECILSFFRQEHQPSPVAARGIESVGFLSLRILYRSISTYIAEGNDAENLEDVFSKLPVWKSLRLARSLFASEARRCQKTTGISDIFLDLVEAAITNRYTPRINEAGATSFVCSISQRDVDASASTGAWDASILVRKLRSVSSNDVETARFFINMTLHFRALCKIVDRLCFNIRKSRTQQCNGSVNKNNKNGMVPLELVDNADSLLRTIGGLGGKPEVGADLDLTGRMTFRFHPALKKVDMRPSSLALDAAGGAGGGAPLDRVGKLRSLSEDIGVFRIKTHFMLVLDPTDMFVVRPVTQMEENRANILCTISLRSVIAAASDGEWLHIAVRHKDVDSLIKNGNMALKFENVGTCLIVKQYLDRSREVLRQELLEKVSELLLFPDDDKNDGNEEKNSIDVDGDDDECKNSDHKINGIDAISATTTTTTTTTTAEDDPRVKKVKSF